MGERVGPFEVVQDLGTTRINMKSHRLFLLRCQCGRKCRRVTSHFTSIRSQTGCVGCRPNMYTRGGLDYNRKMAEARVKRGYSQESLAEAVGINTVEIGHLEHQRWEDQIKGHWSFNRLYRVAREIAKLLDLEWLEVIDPEWLLPPLVEPEELNGCKADIAEVFSQRVSAPNLLESIIESETVERLKYHVAQLKPRHRMVLHEWLNGVSVRDLGKRIGVSRQRVDQITKTTIEIIKRKEGVVDER